MELQELKEHRPNIFSGYDRNGRLMFKKVYRSCSEEASRAIALSSAGLACVPAMISTVEDFENGTIEVYQEGIDGETLLEKAPDYQEKSLARDLIKVADALAEFHGKMGEPLRDLTPDNVIIHGGRAVFIDLATREDQVTHGYEAPEMHQFGGYCRATDIYQLGVMIIDILGKSGLKSVELIALAEECSARLPSRRPLASEVAEHLRRIEYRNDQKRSIWRPLLVVFVLGIISGGTLNRPNIELTNLQKVNRLDIQTAAGIISAREIAASLPVESRMEVCQYISQNTTPVVLASPGIRAWFNFENPLIIADAGAIGLGSRVILESGHEGYVFNINLERCEVMTSSGVEVVRSRIHESNVGFCNTGSLQPRQEFRAAVWPSPKNADIAGKVSLFYGIDSPDLKWPIFGLWIQSSPVEWLAHLAEKPGNLIPVESSWFSSGNEWLAAYIGVFFKTDLSEHFVFYVHSADFQLLLSRLNSELEVSEGMILIRRK